MTIDAKRLLRAKAKVREEAKRIRATCNPALAANLTEHVLRHRPPPANAIVAGYWPMNNEVDMRPLLLALFEKGHTLVLPEAKKPGGVLIFRKWQPGAEMVPGPFGTQHPTGEALVPSYILVPLLAFDIRGYRLGYGTGYYDRTLAELPNAFRLGCAFAMQEIAEVPIGPHDVKMHAIVTEHGLIGTGASNWIK